MRAFALSFAAAAGFASGPASAAPVRSVPICALAPHADKSIGKTVRVQGYVINLSSHGLILASRRGDCRELVQIGLRTNLMRRTSTGQKLLRIEAGASRRATVIGIVGWTRARFSNDPIPVLFLTEVEALASSGTDLQKFTEPSR